MKQLSVNNQTKNWNMMNKLINFLKPWAGAVLVVMILQFTGLLSHISFFAQSAALKTGLMNAAAEAKPDAKDFDYGFTLKDLEGTPIDFNQFKGKVVFLNLWATWCGPCKAEMPTIQKLYDKVRGNENIAFVMLSIDRDKDKPKVVKYLKDKKFTFPGYMPSGYLSEQLNVPSIPTTLIISKAGKIISKEVGTTNFDTPKFEKFLLSEAAK